MTGLALVLSILTPRTRKLVFNGGNREDDSGLRNEVPPKTSHHLVDPKTGPTISVGLQVARLAGPLEPTPSNSKEVDATVVWPRHPPWHPVKDHLERHPGERGKMQRQTEKELDREH